MVVCRGFWEGEGGLWGAGLVVVCRGFWEGEGGLWGCIVGSGGGGGGIFVVWGFCSSVG